MELYLKSRSPRKSGTDDKYNKAVATKVFCLGVYLLGFQQKWQTKQKQISFKRFFDNSMNKQAKNLNRSRRNFSANNKLWIPLSCRKTLAQIFRRKNPQDKQSREHVTITGYLLSLSVTHWTSKYRSSRNYRQNNLCAYIGNSII